MEIVGIILSGIFLFVIIFFAVRLAISPLIPIEENLNDDSGGMSLVKLRDIGIINNEELEEVIKFFERKGSKKYTELDMYCKILSELKEAGYIDDEGFESKIAHLNNYYHNK